MVVPFIFWSLVALLIIFFGIRAIRSHNAVGLYANANPPEVNDVKGHNRVVGIIIIVAGVLFDLLGLPMLFNMSGGPMILIMLPGAMFVAIGMVVVYEIADRKYRKK